MRAFAINVRLVRRLFVTFCLVGALSLSHVTSVYAQSANYCERIGVEDVNDCTRILREQGIEFVDVAGGVDACRSAAQGAFSTGSGEAPDAKPIVGGQSLDGNPTHILSYLHGIDEEKAAAAINVYIQERNPDSPFVGLGESFVTGGKLYNVNPFLPVGHLQMENGFVSNPTGNGWHSPQHVYATAEAARDRDASQLSFSNNAFGRTASSSQPRVFYRQSNGTIRNVFQWSSWAASLDGSGGTEDPWFALINRRYLAAEDSNGTTSFKIASGDFEEYLSHYAPQGDGNNEAAYIQVLKDAIDEMVQLTDSGITYTGPTGGSSESCQAVAGENGWGLPGEANPMLYYSQLREESAPEDSSVTSYWGEFPYGEGTIAGCGCGPTSFAMIVATLTKDPSVTPDVVASWAASNGYRSGDDACAGSAWWWVGNPEETLSRWGVISRQITIDEAPNEIRQGNLIIVSVGPGSPFLSEGDPNNPNRGHLLVMRAVTSTGEFLFADPSDSNSKRANGGDGGPEVDPNIFNGTPPGSSHTPVGADIVTQGLKGLFVVEASLEHGGD
jgi:hypothetical protein